MSHNVPVQSLIDHIKTAIDVDPWAIEMMENLLKEQPEIVRCKDCKHWSAERINDYNKCKRWINVGVNNFATMGDWFCADGERRIDDD